MLRRLILFAAATLTLLVVAWQVQGTNVYNTDLKVDYVRARALRDGVDLFTPIDTLTGRYLPIAGVAPEHASPHPPVLAAAFVPASFLPYPTVCLIWLVANVALLLVVGRWLGLSPLASLALGAWPPLFLTLDWVQWELVLLALVLLAWRAAESGHDARAGFWLGVAAAIKLYPGLLVLPFLARRQYRLAISAALTMALAQLANLAVVGPRGLWQYYAQVVPAIGVSRYGGAELDTSVHGSLLRLLGAGSHWVLPLTAVATILALVALARLPRDAGPAAVLLALPTYVLNIYPTLCLPQIVGAWRAGRFRPLLIVAVLAASFPYYVVDHALHLPPYPVLFGLIEPLGYAGLVLLGFLIGA